MLREKRRILIQVTKFSHYNPFSFAASQTEKSRTDVVFVSCNVKPIGKDEWKSLASLAGDMPGDFLKHLQDTEDALPTEIKEPSRKQDVVRRLESEEGRINDRTKVPVQYELRVYMFRRREERCH